MKKILLIFALFGALFGLEQDNDILSGKLDNGLTYYIKQNKQPKNTGYFYLIVNAGSTDEAPNERGLAHFVEHMAFNGSRDFDKNELIKKLESLGVRFGADLNAQTTYDTTSYNLEIAINDENLKSVFEVFSNWIDGVKFDQNELDKERGVIMEEERQRNTPKYRLFLQQAKNLYKDSIYINKSPIGDMNVIKNVDIATIKGFYERVYQPRFMKFVAVGDFDVKKIKKLIVQNFSDAKNTNDYKTPDKTIPFAKGFEILNYDTKELGINSTSLVFIDNYTPRTSQSIARKIIMDSYISTLIKNYYDKEQNNKTKPIGVSFARPVVQNQKVYYTFGSNVINGDFNSSITEIQSLIKGIKEYGFNEADFNIAKQNYLSSFKTAYENATNKKSKNIAEHIISSLENGSTILSDKDAFTLNTKLVNEITLSDVKARFDEILALNRAELNILSPNGFKLSKSEYEILAKNASPYNLNKMTKVLPKTLINTDIKPKNIVKKEHNKQNDFYTITLENGAKVVLKELKTSKNKISFAAISPGGTSNLDKPQIAAYAVKTSNESGAGEFDNYDIARILSGKTISYDKRIDSLTQGYYGSSSTSDLEFLLQAINLEFNAPRLDENILKQIKTQSIDALKKSQNLPEYKFKTELINFIYNDNPRTKELSQNDIESINLDELKKIVNEKFTNANSYTFFIVGDFDMKNVEPLLKKYIATLPSKNFKENFKDDGVRSIDGIKEFKKELQTSNRSDVSITYKDDNAKYSRLDSLKIRALTSVLRATLREKIREEKGQTYGFNAKISLSKVPFEYSTANISFSTAPQSVSEVIEGINKITKELKEQGSDDTHLQNYKKSSIIQLKKSLEEADFWLRDLIGHFIFENELFDKKWYETTIQNLNNDDIKDMAKKYLDNKNVITTINNPKK
ncbi:zinc-dependent peptidase, M16 family [Campylobacter mucosalis]|uniref:M16 family metallopeptidase n=1 Tax=Campylobacter mucosalis TaxID=202 RepID=UPI001593C811|nr:M16 family metallopeptidase [Campylobacter mucosalis]QKF63040.1 zinc-dependent peptidase, M16 family [Campylobacter mucosalis]